MLEALENTLKTKVLRRNQWKTTRKHKFCVGTYGKRKGNIGLSLEPNENTRKTKVLRRNLLKRMENINFAWELMENTKKT